MIIKSIETDDDIRKKVPWYTKSIGSLDVESRFLVFENVLSSMLTWVVFYLDYFLLVNESLLITSALIRCLPRFSRHFAPHSVFGWSSLCASHWLLLQSHWCQGYSWHSSGFNRRSFSTKEFWLVSGYTRALLRNVSSWRESHDTSQTHGPLFRYSEAWQDTPKPKVISRNWVYPQQAMTLAREVFLF